MSGYTLNLDACAQTRGGKLPSGEVHSALIAEIETFDDAINVATVEKLSSKLVAAGTSRRSRPSTGSLH